MVILIDLWSCLFTSKLAKLRSSEVTLFTGYANSITKNTFTHIIENLNVTLEELDIVCHDATKEFVKEDNYLELTKLKKLKRLYHDCIITAAHVETLKLHLPNLDTNTRTSTVRQGLNIAKTCWEHGIWEIKEKQFLTRTEPTCKKGC